jgi:site-specific DNA recombinase
MNSKKAVAYVRISSVKQIDNESPETQKEAIRKYAEANNLEIVAWFEDIAKTGKNTERDGLQELLKFCMSQKGEIQHWIVYNMKRASRDIDTYSTNVRTVLKSIGITVRSATEPAVTDTKEGRFMENLLVMLGQLDNEGKAEDTVNNMTSLAMQGYWQHPPVVGYDNCKIPNELGKPRPSLIANSMAPKVKDVLERFSIGDVTKAELTRYAEKAGLRSRYGKVMSEDSINRLIKNPVYAGFVKDKFTDYELVSGKHVGIISDSTYERNQQLLYGKNSRKGEVHTQKNEMYPLKGLLKCGSCLKNLYASAPRTGNGSYSPRYHCSRKECTGKTKSVKVRVVHDDFEKMLQKIKPSEQLLKLYNVVLVREANTELGRLNGRIEELRKELSGIDNTRVIAIQKFTEGQITISDKDALTESLDRQKAEKSMNLEDLESQQNIREADIDSAINVMDKVDRQWANSEIDIQIRFQEMLFPDGLVYDSSTGKFGTSSISTLYRYVSTKKGSEEPSKSDLVAGPGLEPGTSWL